MKATATFYKNNPASKAKKDAYNSTYNKKESAVKKRVEANTANRKSQAAGKTKVGDGKDYSHTINSFESASKNRGRSEKSRLVGSKRK